MVEKSRIKTKSAATAISWNAMVMATQLMQMLFAFYKGDDLIFYITFFKNKEKNGAKEEKPNKKRN